MNYAMSILSLQRLSLSKEIIGHAVGIYYLLNASLRDTAQALSYRGLDISHGTIRACVYKFGTLYASHLRKRQPQRGDKWHLDEVCLRMNGQSYCCDELLIKMAMNLMSEVVPNFWTV